MSTLRSPIRLPFALVRLPVLASAWSRSAIHETAALSPLFAPAAVAWLSYIALSVLLQSPAFRPYDAGKLPYTEALRNTAFALAPNSLLAAPRDTPASVVAVLVYFIVVLLLLAAWCRAVGAARRIELSSCVPLLLLTALVSVPLLLAPGLLSDDVYLYDVYGRAISVYGANPVLLPPSALSGDAHLPWVHWKELPSAYGPIWLMLSAGLSAATADSLTATVLIYRVAAAALHLGVAAMLWRVLRQQPPGVRLAATIFYAWNPLVLLEVVANAHNDVLVALFAVLLAAAAIEKRWTSAACLAACAVMVKPFAVLLVPVIGRGILLGESARPRLRQAAIAAAAAAATGFAVAVPLWSGAQLVRNAIHNPAAHMYTNTVWELMSEIGPAWWNVKTVAVQHPYLDVLRGLGFVAGLAWILTRRRSPDDVGTVAVRLWLVFCLTACWVWPWYFVPALALAPLAGTAQLPAGAALTVGGLLFWATWPERKVAPLDDIYWWRSFVLFGPLLLTWLWAPARSWTLTALGLRSRIRPGNDADDIPLRTAA